MDSKNIMYANNCVKTDKAESNLRDEVKMLEISEAINDIDSKLTDLEIALNIVSHDNG